MLPKLPLAFAFAKAKGKRGGGEGAKTRAKGKKGCAFSSGRKKITLQEVLNGGTLVYPKNPSGAEL